MMLLSFVASSAWADEPAPPQPAQPPPDLVLLPRALAVAPLQLLQAIVTLHPQAVDQAVITQLWQEMTACLKDNPTNGVVTRQGQDQCPQVTEALAKQGEKQPDKKAEKGKR